MIPMRSTRNLLSALLTLAGATVAIFITGTQDAFAMAAFFCAAGLAAMVARPAVRPSCLPVVLASLYCVLAALTLLPLGWFTAPAWRAAFPSSEIVHLGGSLAPMPALVWFWWLVLAGTCAAGAVLLTGPLEGRALAVFLHSVAAVVAVYAVLAVVDRVTPWTYPFSDKAPFGFLPNRNHTATLLFVGAIVSFGLMQWELTHGRRAAATLAALCAAPPMAALLFFSVSRAGVACLAAGLLLWGVGMSASGGRRKSMLITVAVLAVFLVGLFVAGGSEVRDRLGSLWKEVLATEAGAESGAHIDFRQPVFRDTVDMVADLPWSGSGLGHFTEIFPQYRQGSVRAASVLHPESDWLMVAAETGLPSALILVVLAGWFLTRCWQARDADDGLLRWTAASAIGAALIHGMLDVPWHRPAVGWFLLVLALVAVPSSGLVPRFPAIWRAGQILTGLALLAGGLYLAWQNTTDRPPLPYRWAAYNAELTRLGKDKSHDEGEFVAREAVRDFPFNPQAHYWHMAFLRTFLGTEPDMEQASRLGRFVEPVLPLVAAEQALTWADIDPSREAGARAEAVRRAARIDLVEGRPELSSAGQQIRVALEAAKDRPEVQRMILEKLGGDPVMTAYWVRFANPDLVAEWAAGMQDPQNWFDGLPQGLREAVLVRWIALPDPSVAVSYMEARSAAGEGAYWRTLAKHYASVGDKPRAVALVAGAAGVKMEDRGRFAEGFGKELAALEASGNDVAVRRLLQEALAAKKADADQLSTAMAWYAAAGDWDNAWKAAARLAAETKVGQ